MTVKLLSWNVNSIRQRMDHLSQLVEVYQPDVICLQETKVTNDLFPQMEILALGYPHQAIHGMKSYNGMVTLAKQPLANEKTYSWCGRDDCRHQSVELSCGLELHNLYIPAGGDVPDADLNPKFAHKLNFLSEQADWWRKETEKSSKVNRVIVGDFNVAPLENDVWSHKALKKTITHTPIEVDHLNDLQQSGQWVDAMRLVVPSEEKLFTWWSYRNRNWPGDDPSKDRGRRLDHVWVSPGLTALVSDIEVITQVRGWERPSDHAPVLTTLDLA
jgi:exodeoxyribonuclease-3